MHTFKLAFVAVIGFALSGCSTMGSLAMGTVKAVGTTTLFVTDLATFGAVSGLTGNKDKAWAVSASDSGMAYTTVAAARSSSPTYYVPPIAKLGDSGTVSSNRSTSTSAKPTEAPSKRRYAAFSCMSVIRGTANDVIHNACGHVIEAHWYDTDGGWNMWSVQSDFTVSGSRVSKAWACEKNDSLDKATGVCIDNDGSDRW
jgi:hypothetical protein